MVLDLLLLEKNLALAKEILKQVNAARTSPENFLKANREAISENEPKYIPLLEKAKALPSVPVSSPFRKMRPL